MSTNRFTDTHNKSFIKSCNTLTKLNPLESEFTPEVRKVKIIIFTFMVQKTCGSMERSKLSGYKLNSKDCLLLFCFLIRLIMIENI